MQQVRFRVALSAQVLMVAIAMTSLRPVVDGLLPHFPTAAATTALVAAYLLLGTAVPMGCVWAFERSSRRAYLRRQGLALVASSAAERSR